MRTDDEAAAPQLRLSTAAVRRAVASAGMGTSGLAGREPELIAALILGGSLRAGASGMRLDLPVRDTEVMRRYQRLLIAMYGAHPVPVMTGGFAGEPPVRVLRVSRNAESVALRAGMISPSGRVIPPDLPGAHRRPEAARAAVRGAFLVCGEVVEPSKGRRRIEFTCPSASLARQLGLCLRQIGVRCTATGVQVKVTNPRDAATLLASIGAASAARQWAAEAASRPQTVHGNFKAGNDSRKEVASHLRTERVALALERLGAEVPAHLREVGTLALAHPDLSLAELGEMCVPEINKNTFVGRLRSLYRTAGVPGGHPKPKKDA